MEQRQAVVYRLFAMSTNDKTVAVATQYRFQRITPNYTLIYGTEEPDGVKFAEITAEELHNLSRKDFQWLEDANLVLIREFEEEHREAQGKAFKQFIEELDKNIKEELNGERTEESATE